MDEGKMRNGSDNILDDKIESLSETVRETLMEETADILLSLGDFLFKIKGIDHNITKNIDGEEDRNP